MPPIPQMWNMILALLYLEMLDFFNVNVRHDSLLLNNYM